MSARPALRWPAPHASEQRDRFQADLAQDLREQRVLLEAVAAAPLVKKLPFEIAKSQADLAAGLNRQVLEEERLAVREMEPAQRLDVGGATARVDRPA